MISSIDWKCKNTWAKSSYNTLWCLIGCSIGDFGTIIYFQNIDHSLSIYFVMLIAIINGIVTSIILETLILLKQMNFSNAINTAFKMSIISMLVMEVCMNAVDLVFAGGVINLWIIPFMLIAGFLSALPYNYYRLKKYNESCH
jgi:energy-converting hydrogenase Eha subunit A